MRHGVRKSRRQEIATTASAADPEVAADEAAPGPSGPGPTPTVLLVAAGGAVGTLLRALAVPAGGAVAGGVLVATAAVNLSGALALGVLVTALGQRPQSTRLRLVLGVGVLGSFTTWSSLAVQVALLVRDDRFGTALGYGLGSVAAGVVAAAIGLRLGRTSRLRS